MLCPQEDFPSDFPSVLQISRPFCRKRRSHLWDKRKSKQAPCIRPELSLPAWIQATFFGGWSGVGWKSSYYYIWKRFLCFKQKFEDQNNNNIKLLVIVLTISITSDWNPTRSSLSKNKIYWQGIAHFIELK